jgi:thioredoxin reductase/bacterioferritin-associated ferredoxin
MSPDYDLIIIGAGPAGMTAAQQAVKYGLSVIVLEETLHPGGQMYRNIEQGEPKVNAILGHDYAHGRTLVQPFRKATLKYVSEAVVWHIDADLGVCYSVRGNARQIKGKRILIATGARERPFPIAGWTLPGVMAATAADVLLKSDGILPSGEIVLAGSGPLLLLTAVRLLRAGASVKAFLDTTPRSNFLKSIPCLPKALLAPEYLIKGLALKWVIRHNRIPVYSNVKMLEAMGSEAVRWVRFSHKGSICKLKTDTLLLHNGVVPDTQLSCLLQCEHQWDAIRRYWQPVTDLWGNSSVAGIGIAGDAAGITGARAAESAGHLAALEAAYALKRISARERNRNAIIFQKRLARERAVRPFLDRLFSPRRELLIPEADETVVCRCEEVTAGQIRQTLKLGAVGPNQLKTQTRTGMGPCQGRMCGLTISEMIADHHEMDVSRVGYYHIRPPLKPVTVKELAELELKL